MSSLLEFHHTVLDNNHAVYSVERGELNPKKIETEEISESAEVFKDNSYDLVSLREYMMKHSLLLSNSGNIIKGVKKGNSVTLTVLKVK